MRSFVKNESFRTVAQYFQCGPALARARRKKAHEAERISRQSACHQRGKKRGWARNNDDLKPAIQSGANDALSGIGNSRHACIGDKRNARSAVNFRDQLLRTRSFVVLVIALRRRLDFKMVEQFLSVARVFAGDYVGLAQHAQSPQSNVFQIADGSCDYVKARRQLTVRVVVGRQGQCSLAFSIQALLWRPRSWTTGPISDQSTHNVPNREVRGR